MKIYLVRHGKAEPRSQWKRSDLLRPLDAVGEAQARSLASALSGAALSRIVTSPALRCQQTVEILSQESGIPVEIDERLAEGESVQRALQLLPAPEEEPVLYCSHVDLITGLLQFFELADAEGDGPIRCRKGSVWRLEGPAGTPTAATYLEPVERSARQVRGGPRSERVAALDLGSTSFNLLVADLDASGGIRPVVRERLMLRLGAVIASDAEIPPEVCERAVDVAQELLTVVEREKVGHLLPVATAALRDAHNGAALAERIAFALGTPVRILSGEEEAGLIFSAFQRRVPLGPDRALGLDLGGGSVELAVGHHEEVLAEVSVPLGVARLHGEFVRHDPMRRSEVRQLRKRVRTLLEPHRDALLAQRPTRAIATGGTIRALARLVAERGKRGSRAEWPMELSLEALDDLTTVLESSSHAERLDLRGIRRARADLLPTGAIVLETLVDELNIDRLTVSDWGLREGVMLDHLRRRAHRAGRPQGP